MEPFTLAPASETAAVGVLAQSASSCAAELLTIRAWATRYGLEVVDLGTSAEPNGGDAGCQLVIALGGDGTILRALQVAMAQHAAVLGVNFGHVGFLADIRGDELVRGAGARGAAAGAARRAHGAGGADRGGARAPVHRVQRRGGRAAARLRPGPAAGRGRGRVAAGAAGRRGRHRVADRLDGLHGRGRRSGGGAVPRCHRHHAAGLAGHAVALARGRRQRDRPRRARGPAARR